MNILLDAYFDQNFGDDVFVKCITKMFPNYKFYAFLEYYPQKVCDWAEGLTNLYILPECNVFLNKNMFDAYICVGGDIFPDRGNFDKRKSYVDSVKQCNGVVAFIGFSLFHEYCDSTRKDICKLMENADIIAPRDRWSANLLKKWLPHKDIPVMADLAFSFFDKVQRSKEAGEVLGISVRKPSGVTEEKIEAYCNGLAETIDLFLTKKEKRKVRVFSLSHGTWEDTEITDRIRKRVKDSHRLEHFVYTGDARKCYESMAGCSVMICTRLHAMIAALALDMKCIPIVYEVKQEHLLEEISYTGKTFAFSELNGIYEYLEELIIGTKKQWCDNGLRDYLDKSKPVLEDLSKRLAVVDKGTALVKKDTTGVSCEEKQYAKTQVEEVLRKNREVKELVLSMEEIQQTLQECQNTNETYLRELEACNKRNSEYFTIIEEQNRNYSELERVKDEYIASLNAENKRLDAVIIEQQQEVARLQQENRTLEQEKAHSQQNNTDTKSEYDVLLEQWKQLEAEYEEMTHKVNQYEDILNRVRPYFASNKGGFITKQMSNLLEMKEKGSKENWEKIMEFYK